MYAVIREGGKQYKVEPGESIEIDLKGNVKKAIRWNSQMY